MRKFAQYIIILITIFAGVGFFSPTESEAQAFDTTRAGTCTLQNNQTKKNIPWKGKTEKECHDMADNKALYNSTFISWVADNPNTTPTIVCTLNGKVDPTIKTQTDCNNAGGTWGDPNASRVPPSVPTGDTEFERQLDMGCDGLWNSTFQGCILELTYVIFHDIPAYYLAQTAYFFNVVIAVSLDGALFKHDFVAKGWAIVRDLSNIFFIMILLYISIKIILGLGEHGVQKMIAQVVVVALLINFSMFFTGVMIDTSNVLGRIFYSKLKVDTKRTDGQPRPYAAINKEKDISGGLVAAFDPTQALKQDFFDEARKQFDVNGDLVEGNHKLPFGTMLAIIIVSGAIMCFAIYALFMSAFSFLGRLIELWLLIMASPFAFMSSIIPKMAHLKDWGWDNWLSRLISAAFMAPAFMFFLYFIFLLIQSEIFTDIIGKPTPGINDPAGIMKLMLGIVLPMMIILTLLLKAVKLAKTGSGDFADTIVGVAKMGAGLAIGGASLGVAAAGRATLGATAKFVQNKGAREKAFKYGDLTTAVRQDWYKPWKYPSIAGKAISGTAKFVPAAIATGLHGVGIGDKLKHADEAYGHKTHASHILDAKMQSEFGHQYGKEGKFKDLTEHEQTIVKDEVDKDEMAKFLYGKLFKDLEAPQAAEIQAKHNGTFIDPATGLPVGPQRAISNSHGKTVSIEHANATLAAGHKVKSDYFVDMSKENAAMGEFLQALRKGSYDLRNLADMSAKSKGFPKLGVGLIAAVAAGVRLGIKKGAGVEYGTPQKDLFKDLGNTISEALKNVKINVGGSHGGGGHGGGHGDSHAKEVKSVGH